MSVGHPARPEAQLTRPEGGLGHVVGVCLFVERYCHTKLSYNVAFNTVFIQCFNEYSEQCTGTVVMG